MVMVCGDDSGEEPLVFLSVPGSLERFAEGIAGVPGGLLCAVAIASIVRTTQFWLWIAHGFDGSATGRTRFPNTSVLAAQGFGDHARVLEEQIARLRRVAE